MARRIVDLVLKEVSLVDDPANGHAVVEIVKMRGRSRVDDVAKRLAAIRDAIAKAKGFKACDDCTNPEACKAAGACALAGVDKSAKSFEDAMRAIEARRAAAKAMSALWDAFDALRDSIDSIVTDEAVKDKKAAVAESVDQFKIALDDIAPQPAVAKALAEGLSADPAALAAFNGATTMTLEELQKALETAETNLADLKKAQDGHADIVKAKDAEIAKMKGEIDGLKAEIAKSKEKTAEPDDVFKSLPAAAREAIEKANKDAAEAKDKVEKMQTAQAEAEAIAKAKGFGVADPDKLGPVLVRVAKGKSTAEDAALIEKAFAGLAEIAKDSKLFKSIGTGTGRETADDPEANLAKAVEDIRKSEPKLTKEQAVAKAMEANPGLYDAFVANRRAA
jgi:DNA repair exonuclease SbcCD ATPase subunit